MNLNGTAAGESPVLQVLIRTFNKQRGSFMSDSSEQISLLRSMFVYILQELGVCIIINLKKIYCHIWKHIRFTETVQGC